MHAEIRVSCTDGKNLTKSQCKDRIQSIKDAELERKTTPKSKSYLTPRRSSEFASAVIELKIIPTNVQRVRALIEDGEVVLPGDELRLKIYLGRFGLQEQKSLVETVKKLQKTYGKDSLSVRFSDL